MNRKAPYVLILTIIITLSMTMLFIQIKLANGVSEEKGVSDCSEFVAFVKELFEDVATATDYRYDAKDNQDCGLDTIKIIENPEGGYLGIYHSPGGYSVRLANSTDLLHWTFIKTIESDWSNHTSQPTFVRAPNGAYIVAFEKEEIDWSHLRFLYYSNLSALLNPSYSADALYDAPRFSIWNKHEGTPNIYNITIKDSNMTACVGFHYDNGFVDNVAVGYLTIPLDDPENTTRWTWNAKPQTEYNRKLREDWGVEGNIGDRDYGQIFGRNFTLQEGCLIERNGHWAHWRIFLYDHLTNNFTILNIKTHKDSMSFGNPTFTWLKSPNGKDCVVVTYFLFSEGAESGEAGELIFYKEFDTERFPIEHDSKSYFIDVTSNSTISNFNFNETERSINFNVSGPDGSKGYCIVKLPNNFAQSLWQGNYTVLIDGEYVQTEIWTDGENTYIYFTYEHPEHEVTILQIYATLQISSTIGGVTSPSPGLHSYVLGDVISVLAIADDNYVFEHWELDGSNVGSDNPVSILMDDNHTLLAVFVLRVYNLTITSTVEGTTDPVPGTYEYTAESLVNVTATPNLGYSFVCWLLDGEERTENPITVIMDGNYTLDAFFVDDIPPEIGTPVQEPKNVTAYENVTVTVNVTDHGTGVYNVTLWYSIDNGTNWAPLNLTEIFTSTYQATIPGYEDCTWVYYKIIAYDNNENPALNDKHGYYYRYPVIPEFPSFIIMLVFMIATLLLAVIVYRRKRSMRMC